MKPLRFRVARPTDHLEALLAFYGPEGLGLTEIGSFRDHNGFDGVMLGIPGAEYHLEFTRHRDGSPCPAPTRDNLLVFYLADRAAVETVAVRMQARGHSPVTPENPYWEPRGLTFEDPEGWRVVVVDASAGA